MNKLAIISAFLGGVKNRYMVYEPERILVEKFDLAAKIDGVAGLELCYPADFDDLSLLKSLLADQIDRDRMDGMLTERDPPQTKRYLYQSLL